MFAVLFSKVPIFSPFFILLAGRVIKSITISVFRDELKSSLLGGHCSVKWSKFQKYTFMYWKTLFHESEISHQCNVFATLLGWINSAFEQHRNILGIYPPFLGSEKKTSPEWFCFGSEIDPAWPESGSVLMYSHVFTEPCIILGLESTSSVGSQKAVPGRLLRTNSGS